MPEFISKLQHKYYEKGEFTDEKVRNLEETIQLIRSFPWNKERGTDIQLTGPSVTIRDKNGNYLKIALFFNGKYCLYYLDTDSHLYEYHTANLDEACDIVTKFFGGEISLQIFEKHLFSTGVRKHFEAGNFEYRISMLRGSIVMFLFTLIFLLPVIMTLCFLPKGEMLWPPVIMYMLLLAFISRRYYLTVRVFLKARHTFIYVTGGDDSFIYGSDDDYKTYYKKDVSALNVFGGMRSSKIVGIAEIELSNGSVLSVPEMLIDKFSLVEKFRDVKINYISSYFAGNKALMRFYQ